MCLILLSYQSHPQWRLVVAANRDEHHDRPAAPAAFWSDAPSVLAGRDLRSGGTWMGISRSGRFSAVTNYREPVPRVAPPRSRGSLVADFLQTDTPVRPWVETVREQWHEYGGFSLFTFDTRELLWMSNRSETVKSLEPGIYGLGNLLLDSDEMKVVRGKRALRDALDRQPDEAELAATLLDILADQTPAAADELDREATDPDLEAFLSPIFIRDPRYGTRASAVILVGHEGSIRLVERVWNPDGAPGETRSFRL